MVYFVRGLGALLAIAAVVCLPLIISDYYSGLITKIMIYATFALSLQLLVGGVGLVSLGHSAFFGLAAYSVTLFSPEYSSGNYFLLLCVSVGIAMLYAAATGALALRTRGIYFIMVTLAFAQMAYYLMHDTKLGGGSDGIYLNVRPQLRLGDWTLLSLENSYVFYLFVFALLLVVWFFLVVLMRSRFGAALTGIRVNEQRMRAAGYSTFIYKFTAYVLAGALAGVAGGLYAINDGYVNPQLLAWEQSGLVLLMVILGGTGRLWGAVIGSVLLILLEELFQSHALFGGFADHWHLPFGLAIIGLVAVLPNGAVGLPEQMRAYKLRRKRQRQVVVSQKDFAS